MMDLVKVEGHDGLRKDPQSGGVVNVNMEAYTQAIKAEKERIEKERKIQDMANRLDQLEQLVQRLLEERQ